MDAWMDGFVTFGWVCCFGHIVWLLCFLQLDVSIFASRYVLYYYVLLQ